MPLFRKLAVVGAGTMGSQIALQTAYSGRYEVLDFSGLDIFYGALEDRRMLEGGAGAPALLREKVERGELGRKTGRGFHDYGQR